MYIAQNTIKIDFIGYFILVNIMTAASKCKQGFLGYSLYHKQDTNNKTTKEN